jgi:pimeloyl-ACP methyl ester carboxylesterase
MAHRVVRLAALAVLAATGLRPHAWAQTEEVLPGVTVHAPDGFYDPPAEPGEPGALLKSEPLTGATLPEGMRGWRILYATTVDDTTPATAVATVFAPDDPPPGPRPVIVWEHGTTGMLQACMPSLTSAPTLGIPALGQALAAGWVIVATDYQFAETGGPHPYLVGEGEARAGLDSFRAARQLPELSLDGRAVVWGHSQGGHAALWTGIIGPSYAPEVEIAGVAAIAPAADVASILAGNPAADKLLGPYLALSYSRFYPDVSFEAALRPEALAAGREMAELCGFLPAEHPQRIAALAASFDGRALASDPALAARLAENAATGTIDAPVLIAQGLADEVVPAPATDAFVETRCAAGQRLEYWTFAGVDHAGIVRPGTPLDPPLAAWTAARFAGEPQAAGCARSGF